MLTEILRVRHVVLDMDGTIYRGSRLFDCTLRFLEQLQSLGIGYTFLTNNTSRGKADYVEKLRGLGIRVREQQIYTSADSTIAYLRRSLPAVKRIAVLGTPSLCRQFEGAHFVVDREAPQAVIVGFDTTLNYERLCRAAYWIREGLPFIGTHPDLVCPTDEPTVLVDCGAICACLAAATGRSPILLGKPDPAILRGLSEQLQVPVSDIAVVGDRLYTDIAMAQKAGAISVLVLSGEATAKEADAMPQSPDLVVPDIGVLGKLLGDARNRTSQ